MYFFAKSLYFSKNIENFNTKKQLDSLLINCRKVFRKNLFTLLSKTIIPIPHFLLFHQKNDSFFTHFMGFFDLEYCFLVSIID